MPPRDSFSFPIDPELDVEGVLPIDEALTVDTGLRTDAALADVSVGSDGDLGVGSLSAAGVGSLGDVGVGSEDEVPLPEGLVRQPAGFRGAPALAAPPESIPLPLRDGSAPLSGGPLAVWRFARAHRLLRLAYLPLFLRWAWLKVRYRGRFVTDGLCFVMPGVTFEIGPEAKVIMGRWSWIGHDTKIRAHEGVVEIGAKSVLGQECTISCYQHVSVGRECIIADRTMMIDFDHGVVDTERPIRDQGIYKRDVRVGHNVWIGYGACLLRGVSVGDNAVIGTSSVVTKDVPDNAVVAGAPAKVIRFRDAPQTFRWG